MKGLGYMYNVLLRLSRIPLQGLRAIFGAHTNPRLGFLVLLHPTRSLKIPYVIPGESMSWFKFMARITGVI